MIDIVIASYFFQEDAVQDKYRELFCAGFRLKNENKDRVLELLLRLKTLVLVSCVYNKYKKPGFCCITQVACTTACDDKV